MTVISFHILVHISTRLKWGWSVFTVHGKDTLWKISIACICTWHCRLVQVILKNFASLWWSDRWQSSLSSLPWEIEKVYYSSVTEHSTEEKGSTGLHHQCVWDSRNSIWKRRPAKTICELNLVALFRHYKVFYRWWCRFKMGYNSGVSLYKVEESTVTISLKIKLKSTIKAGVVKDCTVWHSSPEMWQTSCHAPTPGSPLESPICTCLAESSAFQCDVLGAFGGLPLWSWHTHSEPPTSPSEPTGRSEETCDGLRCEVGQWRTERDEDMRRVSGSSAAPKHPSRWVKDMFFSFYWSLFFQR